MAGMEVTSLPKQFMCLIAKSKVLPEWRSVGYGLSFGRLSHLESLNVWLGTSQEGSYMACG